MIIVSTDQEIASRPQASVTLFQGRKGVKIRTTPSKWEIPQLEIILSAYDAHELGIELLRASADAITAQAVIDQTADELAAMPKVQR